MSDVKRYIPVDQWGQELTKCMEQDEHGFYVRATDYDALAARLAEVEATSLARYESLHAAYARLAEAERLLQKSCNAMRSYFSNHGVSDGEFSELTADIPAFLRATDSASVSQETKNA